VRGGKDLGGAIASAITSQVIAPFTRPIHSGDEIAGRKHDAA
jgi:hypothetical protein